MSRDPVTRSAAAASKAGGGRSPIPVRAGARRGTAGRGRPCVVARGRRKTSWGTAAWVTRPGFSAACCRSATV